MYAIIKTHGISMRRVDIFITVYEHSVVYSEEGGELHRCYFQICVYSGIRFSSFSYSSSFSSPFFPPPLPPPSLFHLLEVCEHDGTLGLHHSTTQIDTYLEE